MVKLDELQDMYKAYLLTSAWNNTLPMSYFEFWHEAMNKAIRYLNKMGWKNDERVL